MDETGVKSVIYRICATPWADDGSTAGCRRSRRRILDNEAFKAALNATLHIRGYPDKSCSLMDLSTPNGVYGYSAGSIYPETSASSGLVGPKLGGWEDPVQEKVKVLD